MSTFRRWLGLCAFLLPVSQLAYPQGCTQCRDNAAATHPQTQAAYRRAIALLVLSGGGLFIVTIVLLRRQE